MQKIIEQTKPTSSGTNQKKDLNTTSSGRRFNFNTPRKDLNTMDVDALIMEERTNLMKQGACFYRHTIGHLSKDCPKKSKNNRGTSSSTQSPCASSSNYTLPKKTSKEMHAHIRALIAQMDNDEKEKFYKEAEETGF